MKTLDNTEQQLHSLLTEIFGSEGARHICAQTERIARGQASLPDTDWPLDDELWQVFPPLHD